MKEISTYRSNVRQMENGEEYFLYASEQVGRQPVMELNINNTELAELPKNDAEFWSKWPAKLGVLNLMHNKLNTLPNLGCNTCSSLQVLCLSFNSFTVAPEEAFQCHQLINFNMIANQLRSIPTTLSKLTCLVNLFLGYNSLQWLPDVFDRLPQLQTVGFEHNFLASLPRTVSKLDKLVRFDLASNRFTSVPDVLFGLPSLRMLDLRKNRVQVIPKGMEKLAKSLTSLQLNENPLQLATLKECPDSQKLEVLREWDWSSMQPRKGLRVLALGKCGSGKTSLVRAVAQGEYVTPIEGNKHEHTIGIEQYFKTLNIKDNTLELIIWDFAGENTYAMMNQLFLSDGTLVWIVVNLEDYHKGSYYESLGIWLGSVMARMSRPVVWIVGTHADRFSEHELDRLQADLENQVRKECTGCAELIADRIRACNEQLASPADSLFSVTQKQVKQLEALKEGGPTFLQENYRVILLSNTYGFKHQKGLLDALQNLSTVFLDLLEVLPDEWVAATDKLRCCGVKDLSVYQPPIVELDGVCQQLCGILNSPQEVDKLISYLHRSGEVLRLAEGKVLLDVLWLIDLLKELFRHDLMESIRSNLPRLKKAMTEDAIEKSLDEFEAGKVILRDLLEALWSPLGISKSSFPLVVRLLQEFGLAYEVTTQSGCCGYLFPWLLHVQSQVTLPACNLFTKQESKHITVRYDFIHYVPGFFEHFLTCCYPVLEFGEIGRYATESSSVHELVTHVSADNGSVSVTLIGRQNRGTGDTLCHSEKIEIIASGNSDVESYDPVWKVTMQLVGMFEKLLSSERRDKFERSVLCPECVDARQEKPKLFHFELQYPGPHHLKEYHRCSKCTQRSGKTSMVAVKKLVPKQGIYYSFTMFVTLSINRPFTNIEFVLREFKLFCWSDALRTSNVRNN